MAYQIYFHTLTRQESVLFPFPNAHHYPKPPISGPITSTTAANNEIVSAASNSVAELQIQICPQHTQREQPGADIKTKVIYMGARAHKFTTENHESCRRRIHAHIQNPPNLRVKQRSESRPAQSRCLFHKSGFSDKSFAHNLHQRTHSTCYANEADARQVRVHPGRGCVSRAPCMCMSARRRRRGFCRTNGGRHLTLGRALSFSFAIELCSTHSVAAAK